MSGIFELTIGYTATVPLPTVPTTTNVTSANSGRAPRTMLTYTYMSGSVRKVADQPLPEMTSLTTHLQAVTPAAGQAAACTLSRDV